MKKVLVATEKPFAAVAVNGIKEIVEGAGYELVLLEKYTDKAQLLAAVADVDAVIIRSDIADEALFEAAKNLKIVVRAGAGYDNINLEAATAHNVCAMNTPGQNANAVAELALGLMVYAARNTFNGASGFELKGKKLGIQGFGNIGRLVARLGAAFGMDIYVHDLYAPDIQEAAKGYTIVEDVRDLYKNCNFISLHIPATPQTKGSIGRELVASMPKNAVLVNTARKEVINEAELIEMLAERADFKYMTDVAPAALEEFAKFEGRFFASPKKMGAQTAEANINAGLAAARQIVDFFENGNERFRLNK
ncbi:MAG: 3-phosphoglycerate dehydrogenase [Bacteroidaceae bacterium]|nr:3-phosphoglycerate dehydrogenase [Bacteroidaceae bacterium]